MSKSFVFIATLFGLAGAAVAAFGIMDISSGAIAPADIPEKAKLCVGSVPKTGFTVAVGTVP